AIVWICPWDELAETTVHYIAAYHGDLETSILKADARATRAVYEEGLEAAANGSVVILHVHHSRLLGEEADYAHFVVAQGEDADGNLLVSDPGRAQEIGITENSADQLRDAQQGDATIVS